MLYMINHGISSQDLSIIFDILRNYQNIYVFGSRIKGTYNTYSDLDICIKQKISDYEVESLNEQFTKSDLPFKVDLIIYDKADKHFKSVIDHKSVALSKLQ